MSDITYRLVKGAELTFGELDRNFGTLDSDLVALSDRFDSFASARGLDSARTIRIITDTVDSDLVQLRYEKLDIFRDSAFVIKIIDSTLDSLGLKSLYTTSHHDSDTLVQVDSAYVRDRADSDYVKSAVDSEHVKFIVDSDYIKFVADSSYVERIAEGVSGLDSQNVWDLLDGESRHLLPQSTETYDLGSNLQRWRDLYVRDAYISTTTIYLGTTDSPQRSSISVDSDGNFELASPTSTGLIATSSTGNALDSNVILSMIDSAYVQSREAAGGGSSIDSADVIALIDPRIINGLSAIDSAYVQSRVTLDGVGISDVAVDTTPQLGGDLDVNSNNILFGDSGKAQFGAGPDLEMYHDGSNSFINDIGDGSIFVRSGTTYFQNAAGTKTSFQTNSGGAQKFFYNNDLKIETVDSGAKITGNLTVTGHVEQTGPRMIAGGRILISTVFSQNSSTQKQLFGIFDSQQAPGGADGIQKVSLGVYRFQFDSTNLSAITSSDDYAVTATLDYGYDNPTASSRTVNVLTQRDSSFQLIIERADDGVNEDYSSNAGHINFQVWLY
jgi:hypothetical protein